MDTFPKALEEVYSLEPADRFMEKSFQYDFRNDKKGH